MIDEYGQMIDYGEEDQDPYYAEQEYEEQLMQ